MHVSPVEVHVRQFVLVEVASLTERTVAVQALVVANIGVGVDVLLQIGLLGEPSSADAARVRFGSTVHPQMLLQEVLARKTTVAHLTGKRFLSCVNAQMPVVSFLRFEPLRAVQTGVPLLLHRVHCRTHSRAGRASGASNWMASTVVRTNAVGCISAMNAGVCAVRLSRCQPS